MLLAIPVHIAAYDPRWPALAGHYAGELAVLRPSLVTVHHIGSTSVVGLSAKPVIDLMPIVKDLASLDSMRGRVEALGYGWHGEFGIDGRRYCTLADDAGKRIVQLHFYAQGSLHARRHLAFRDYLRAHPAVAADYEAEKLRARALHPDNSHAYSEEKGAWIRAAEAKALAWFVGDGVLI
jgi:GrpB-like predicted nucleotidyltransferase (UPF0157 family)